MRSSHDAPSDGHSSPTPIYDALFTEYRHLFKALPGDRSGEDAPGFTAFGTGLHSTGGDGHGSFGTGLHSEGTGHYGSNWGGYDRYQSPGGRFPAALPPAPRRGS